MTNAMKIPFPKGALEEGKTRQRVDYLEGKKADIISWGFINPSSTEASFVSKSCTVSNDDGITLTWRLAFVKSYESGRACYYIFPCVIKENDYKEAFVKIELTFYYKTIEPHSRVAGICMFNTRDQNSPIGLRIDAEVPQPFPNTVLCHCNCKIIQSNLPKFSLLEDLDNAFKNRNFTDVELLSNDGKVFKAHKMILSARSTVFAAMFTHPMKENEQNQVEIADMNGEVVEDMLRYIYTDKPDKLGRLTKELFVAADKYDLKVLKKMSEDVLITNLSFSNAVEMLLLSESHSATRLKTEVFNFLTRSDIDVMKLNFELFRTEAWKSFKDTDLLKELCEVLANANR